MKSEVLFPNTEKISLPFYISAIGTAQYQCKIKRPNGAPFPQIIIGYEGLGELMIDDTTHTISQNTFIYIPPNIPHSYQSTSGKEQDWKTSWLCFDGTCAIQILNDLQLTTPQIIQPTDTAKFDVLLKNILTTLKNDKAYGNQKSSVFLYDFLIEFKRVLLELKEPQMKRIPYLEPVLNYIDEHIDESITLNTLSDLIHITPQHLCRIFKDILKVRPFTYIQKRRIQLSKKYLSDLNLKIADIASLVGFQDSSYYCLTFKKFEGVTPSEFRLVNFSS